MLSDTQIIQASQYIKKFQKYLPSEIVHNLIERGFALDQNIYYDSLQTRTALPVSKNTVLTEALKAKYEEYNRNYDYIYSKIIKNLQSDNITTTPH
jgi:hypothetical protein